MNDDWFDEVVDGKPKLAEYWQIDFIDDLLRRTPLSMSQQQEISSRIYDKDFSEIEAEELIIYLKENEIKRDPKDQYKQFVKNGMFSS
jgi:hypothetical protein|tara:strand:- start:252 stop:515 length:264 start_codon:yes stop_codon:yes gene_type:complete